ncbi:MAG: thiamine pyrophosphate-dependent dehydrogenase E1 component subunit alpha [Verrucomicrobiaceae bacterium]
MAFAQTITSDETGVSADFRTQYLLCYQHMVLARTLEEKLASLYRAGGRIVGGVYVGKGQEAFSVAVGALLQKGKDIYGPLIRDQAGRIAFGEPILDAVRTYLGVITGPMRGRDGNIHRGRPKEGLLAMISHLGSLLSVVAGALFARRLAGTLGDGIGATSIGDGGTSTGAFHEGLNLAAVEKLPVVVSVANNQYAYSTPNERQYACASLVERAAGYGVEGVEVDATDLDACLRVFREAVARARAGGGPQMVVGSLLRLSGHGEHDDASYIPDSVRKGVLSRDCIAVAERQVLDRGWMSSGDLADLRVEAARKVDQAVSRVSKEPAPDPFKESWQALSSADLVEGLHDA